MKKRVLFTLLAMLILLMSIAPAAYAAEEASGTCGEGITWVYKDHTLTISGSGEMEDGSPWEAYKDKIETVVFTGGVTKVGANAFADYDRLETVDFGDSMREIGKRAFYDCNDIVEIRMPETFRIFGEESFRNCVSLKRVICEGGIMPSFKSACMHTGNFISVFYPPDNPWAWEYTNTVMAAYGGMVSFFMASEDMMENGYTETASVAEETEAAAEATEAVEEEEVVEETEAVAAMAEETVPETTAAATEPVTVPTTEPETEPTVPETTVAETEEQIAETGLELFPEETEPAMTEVEEKSGKGWMGLVIVAGVLTFLLSGAMIFRSARHKDSRYGE